MTDNTNIQNKQQEVQPDHTKRNRLKGLATGGVLIAVGSQWSKPVVNAVLLPAHAQTSPGDNDNGDNGNGDNGNGDNGNGDNGNGDTPVTNTGFAPADQAEVTARFGTIRFEGNTFDTDGTYTYVENGDMDTGTWSYVNTGSNTGTITIVYDGGFNGKSVSEMTFTSENMGTFISTYTEDEEEPETETGSFSFPLRQ